jgi:Tfp pilus assembly protein PilF
MDRRFSLIVGLGLLAGSSGCVPSFFSKSKSTQIPPGPQTVQTNKEAVQVPAPPAAEKKGKETAKRKLQAPTCVAFANFRLRESMTPGKTPPEQQKMREEARQSFRQALEIDPNCVEAHCGLAQCYAADQDHNREVSSYHAALKARPGEAGIWFQLGMSHSRHKEWERAVEALGRASELDPENRQYANTLGFCLARAGLYDQSIALFSRTVGEAKARYNVGRMMIHLGQTERGREQVQLALRMEPNLPGAQAVLESGEGGQGVVPAQHVESAQP